MAWIKDTNADRILWRQDDPAHRLFDQEVWLCFEGTLVGPGDVALVMPRGFATGTADPTDAEIEAALDDFYLDSRPWPGG